MTAPSLELANATPRPSPAAGVADRWKTLAPQAALRGELVRALDLYRSLAAVEPNVPLHRIRAGDCLVKMGQKREALAEYRIAADAYLALGMQVHARSAWRLVLGIVPGDADATARLHMLDRASEEGERAGRPKADQARIDARVRGVKTSVRSANTPTAPEAVVRADQAAAREANVRPPTAEPRTLPEVPAGAGKALAVTPVVPRRADVRAPATATPPPLPRTREALALEFADLDEDEDRIWIDLEGVFEAPARTAQETEPVAFFAVSDGDGESGPSRQSGPVAAPPGSIVEEVTKPVPPPEPV